MNYCLIYASVYQISTSAPSRCNILKPPPLVVVIYYPISGCKSQLLFKMPPKNDFSFSRQFLIIQNFVSNHRIPVVLLSNFRLQIIVTFQNAAGIQLIIIPTIFNCPGFYFKLPITNRFIIRFLTPPKTTFQSCTILLRAQRLSSLDGGLARNPTITSAVVAETTSNLSQDQPFQCSDLLGGSLGVNNLG